MWIFSNSKKEPLHLVKKAQDILEVVAKNIDGSNKYKKNEEELKKILANIKAIISNKNPVQVATLTDEILQNKFVESILEHISNVDLETKKELATIFVEVMQHKIGQCCSLANYLAQNSQLMSSIIDLQKGYDTVLVGTKMFQSICHYPDLVTIILNQSLYHTIYDCTVREEFAISSNAVENFKFLFNSEPSLFCIHVEQNDQFFDKFFEVVSKQHLLSQDIFIDVLIDMLTCRFGKHIKQNFVDNKSNLKNFLVLFDDRRTKTKTRMTLLLSAFLSESKNQSVRSVLYQNRAKLEELLTNLAESSNISSEESSGIEGVISELSVLHPEL